MNRRIWIICVLVVLAALTNPSSPERSGFGPVEGPIPGSVLSADERQSDEGGQFRGGARTLAHAHHAHDPAALIGEARLLRRAFRGRQIRPAPAGGMIAWRPVQIAPSLRTAHAGLVSTGG